MRRRLNRPRKDKIVTVTKEVPVDRIVYRDVPREIIRKKIVHVPMYTNDESLLGRVEGAIEDHTDE